jgi:hypothetical protein
VEAAKYEYILRLSIINLLYILNMGIFIFLDSITVNTVLQKEGKVSLYNNINLLRLIKLV